MTSSVAASESEINLTGIADRVIDGDTIEIIALNGTEYRIRLADVNASEFGQIGYNEAKEFLTNLVYEKTVYLNVDDVYIWDNKGIGNRLVALPYVEYNSTHLINVCEALFEASQVEKKDYDNEFNPYTWELFFLKPQTIPEFPPAAILSLLPIAIFVIAVVYLKLSRRIPATSTGKTLAPIKKGKFNSKNV
jgi:micrococcal nuclease